MFSCNPSRDTLLLVGPVGWDSMNGFHVDWGAWFHTLTFCSLIGWNNDLNKFHCGNGKKTWTWTLGSPVGFVLRLPALGFRKEIYTHTVHIPHIIKQCDIISLESSLMLQEFNISVKEIPVLQYQDDNICEPNILTLTESLSVVKKKS